MALEEPSTVSNYQYACLQLATILGVRSPFASCPGSQKASSPLTLSLYLWAFHYTDSPILIRSHARPVNAMILRKVHRLRGNHLSLWMTV